MKSNTNLHINFLVRTLIFALALVLTHVAKAQYYRPKQNLYLGVTAGMGARSFKISSDIEALKNLKVQEEGFNIGLLFGTDALQARLRQGFYRSSATVGEKVNLREIELGVNVLPLRILSMKSKYFKPYVNVGITRNTLTFVGSYELPKLTNPNDKDGDGKADCCCDQPSDGGMMADPDGGPGGQVAPTDPSGSTTAAAQEEQQTVKEERELGKLSDARVNVGLGMQVVIPMDRFFVTLFGEMKYGLYLNSIPSSIAFSKTNFSTPVIVNFGVAFGLRSR